MVNRIINVITLIGKSIFLIMMFGALVLFSAAAIMPERFKMEETEPVSFKDLLIELAPKYSIPPELAVSIAQAESNFQKDAYRFFITRRLQNFHKLKIVDTHLIST